MRNRYLLLILIFLLAVILRFYNLHSIPSSLTWDEVAWGYNAYSLGIDGKDEFARFLPFDYLESFGDFKPPVYAYLGILPVKLFGLSEFAVRFPSAFLGALTVLITFFLVKEIFEDRLITKKTSPSSSVFRRGNSFKVALVSAFVLAISPWHIMLSRAAFEANVATFFIICGVWLFLRGLRKNNWLLSVSAISFVLSMYTFNTARIVSPLLVVFLVIGSWRQLFQMKKQTVIAFIVGLVILLPSIPFLLSSQAQLRFKEVNIFSDISVVERSNQQIQNDNNTWWSKIIHNRRVGYSLEFARHYLENLTPNFLFIKGDGNPKFSVQTNGQMYLVEAPFLIIGAFLLFRRREGKWWIIPTWLLLGIIPAATARETPHALRIEATLPTFQILVAYGMVQTLLLFKKYKGIKILYTSYLILYTFCFFYFIHTYFVHYPNEYSGEWQYGYKQAIAYVRTIEQDYDAVYMTTDLGRPYAYYLFYLQTAPEEFRRTAEIKRDAFGFVDIPKFGKYQFMTDLHGKTTEEKILYINSSKKVPAGANIKQKVHLLNGTPALVIYTL